jgi:hypothetical protein
MEKQTSNSLFEILGSCDTLAAYVLDDDASSRRIEQGHALDKTCGHMWAPGEDKSVVSCTLLTGWAL